MSMDKQEAIARIESIHSQIAAIEDEAKRLRAIIDAPEIDDRKIIGKACFYSDSNPDCPASTAIRKVVRRYADSQWEMSNGAKWKYVRPATFEELGYPWVEDAKKLIKSIVDAGVGHHVHLCEARRIAAMMEE
jgi:hypothetical protein